MRERVAEREAVKRQSACGSRVRLLAGSPWRPLGPSRHSIRVCINDIRGYPFFYNSLQHVAYNPALNAPEKSGIGSSVVIRVPQVMP